MRYPETTVPNLRNHKPKLSAFLSAIPPKPHTLMSRQGSGGNVIAAICSFFIPGLGQLFQGRLLMALFQFLLAGALWYFLMGWIIHIWSIIDAAKFEPSRKRGKK